MRGLVCNLLVQLLLGLARAESKSCRSHDHILLSHLRLPQPGEPGPRIYIPQEQSGPVIPLGTGLPFVASHDSLGYGGVCLAFKVKVKVILRPTVCRPVRLGIRHSPGTSHQFFPFSIFFTVSDLLMWGAISDEKLGP
jgi:hypothetical protein